MAVRRPIVSVNGRRVQLPEGDTLLSVREQLTADRTYYVRTDGNDSNNGLANNSSGAFRTIQKAVDVAATLDLSIYNLTVRCTGTFTEPVVLKTLVGAGRVIIRGASDDLITMVVSTTNAICFSMGLGYSGTYELSYMKLQVSGTGNCIGGGGGGGSILYGNIDFGPASSHISVGQGQYVRCVGPVTITGSVTGAHIGAFDGGQVRETGQTITLVGTPSFFAFVSAARAATILVTTNTYIGAATGRRYQAVLNGVVVANGGATYLPGSLDGVEDTGGRYV